jgi:hypothetical protein
LPILDAGPYVTAEDVAISVRAILNDLQDTTTDGDLYSDDLPATWIHMQAAYVDCQDILIDNQVATYTKEATITGVPASSNMDRAGQCEIAFTGCTQDGVTTAMPALPTDLLQPLLCYERLQNSVGPFIPMKEQADGKPSWGANGMHRTWDWREDMLIVPTATNVLDFKLRYITYAPEITGPDSVVFVIRIKNALAYLTAARVAESRGSALAAGFKANGLAALAKIYGRDVDRRQRRTYRRRRYRSSAGRGVRGFGPPTLIVS